MAALLASRKSPDCFTLVQSLPACTFIKRGSALLQIPLSAIVLSVVIHSLWGGNAVAAKFALEAFPPFYSAAIRFMFGVLTIWLWCRLIDRRLWPESHEWRPILLISVFFTVQIALMNFGFDATSGINASILISTNPLFAAVFAHYILAGDRLNMIAVAGLLLAFSGVVLTLLMSGGDASASANGVEFGNTGDWLCLASACLLGYRLMASAHVMREVDSYRLAFWQMMISIPVYLLMGHFFEQIRWQEAGWPAWSGLLYQGVVVAGAGFMVSLWLMSRYRPSLIASFGFIAPISGVLLSIALLGESSSQWLWFSLTLVALGLLLLTLKIR